MFLQVKEPFPIVAILWNHSFDKFCVVYSTSSSRNHGKSTSHAVLRGWFCQAKWRHVKMAQSPAKAFLCTKQHEHNGNTANSNTPCFCWRNKSKWEFVAPIILSLFHTMQCTKYSVLLLLHLIYIYTTSCCASESCSFFSTCLTA